MVDGSVVYGHFAELRVLHVIRTGLVDSRNGVRSFITADKELLAVSGMATVRLTVPASQIFLAHLEDQLSGVKTYTVLYLITDSQPGRNFDDKRLPGTAGIHLDAVDTCTLLVPTRIKTVSDETDTRSMAMTLRGLFIIVRICS